MAERRVATRPIDTNAAAMADAALLHLTGGQPIREDQDELQKLWMDAYIANGGGYKEVGGGGSPDSPVEPCPKQITLSPVSVTFWSSHRLLKDEETEWTDTGALLAAPDWTPARTQPVSHSMDEPIGLDVEIRVDGPGGPETGRLVGKIEGETYFDSETTLFEPGSVKTVTMVSNQTVIEKVREQTVDIVWRVWTDASYCEWTTLFTSSNRWFTTIGAPREPNETAHGVTVRRMEAAVDWIGALGTTDTVEIVKMLMREWGEYTLIANKDAPKGHPTYHGEDDGGVWPHLDGADYKAECQAICRLVQRLLYQIGAPGKVELRMVYADPANGSVALEDKRGESPYGMEKFFREEEKIGYALVDQRLSASAVGLVALPDHIELPGFQSPGFNNLEACLRFEADSGEVMYFPGGTGGSWHGSAQEVLEATFKSLAAYRSVLVEFPKGSGEHVTGREILAVMWDYPSMSELPPD